MDRIIIPFYVAKRYIHDGDILLYRGTGFISKMIAWSGRGEYSHVGMASWQGNQGTSLLECIEYREFKGSRVTSLQNQVRQFPEQIDVYRISPEVIEIKTRYVNDHIDVFTNKLTYNGTKAADLFRTNTGLPYGWGRIWLMSKHHLPFLRLFQKPCFEDKSENGKLYPVCSTALMAMVRQTYVDLIPNLSDFEVQPSDLARCRDLHYMFTLGND